jgi:hypothetical protein
MTGTKKTYEYVPGGTRVLNTSDGEPGTILNGYTYNKGQTEWYEYDVETAHGIERWHRDEFILFSEFEDDLA